ncbi:uncharacterized protein yc1106_01981 [Curvularia clavata]|uniref:C2H2-type domain-containing protein n=1 Tax=Curvularia clavata TaxID=95742 RepID=A0A9Q9DPM8_CURCL|nr:uncharacterized protein yc1106_01981 [Curvularia clavata]
MTSLLLFAVLLTVLLRPALAVTPVMDPTPPASPLDFPVDMVFLLDLPDIDTTAPAQPANLIDAPSPEPFESDINTEPVFDGINDAPPPDFIDAPPPEPFESDMKMEPVFDFSHTATPLQPADFIDASSIEAFESDMNTELSPEPSESDMDTEPVVYGVTGDNMPPLNSKNVHLIDANKTTVQPFAVQAHVDGTYNAGDRRRRQARCERGFACDKPGCMEVFDRQCELTRHSMIHLDESKRPHVCPTCNKGFLYPKDLRRHKPVHSGPSSAKVTFRCKHPKCSHLPGFSRPDNLRRHERRQHSSQ